jgi:hypothetical protein
MPISPAMFLLFAIALTCAAKLIYVVVRGRYRQQLQALAREWRMHYSPHDRFDLSNRLPGVFPLPGAAEMRAVDLIYGTEQEFYRFIFTAEYSVGVVRAKYRLRRVVTFREPKGQSGSMHWSRMILASEELEPIDQYRRLYEQIEQARSEMVKG